MAIVTYNAGEYEGGLIKVQFDYDNVTLKPTAFRVINDADQTCAATVTSQSSGDSYRVIVQPHTTFTQPISTGQANRFNLSVQDTGSRVRLVGVTWNFEYPAVP